MKPVERAQRRRSGDGAGADARVGRLAAEQWGVLSSGELRGCGLSADAVSDRVRRGWLHPMHRGVYAVGHANPPLEGRFLAAVKACGPEAVLSHYSAAALWGLVDWDGRHPEVTVEGANKRTHRGIRVHRTVSLSAADRTRRAGIPITTPARALVDLAAMLNPRPLRRAVRQAMSRKRVRVRQLAAAMNRAGPRPGARVLATIIAAGLAPTRSELEDVVLDLIRRGGLAKPDVNVPLMLSGRRVLPDFRWPEQHLVVEADGAEWHDNRLAREDDAERQALLEVHGERVIRVTWRQAITQPAQTLARLLAAGAPTGAPSVTCSGASPVTRSLVA